MKIIRIPRVVASCVATLFFLSASSAIADVNIGSNIIWHDDADGVGGATIEVLGPSDELNIQTIIDAITDASEKKPYIIKLGAGIYNVGETQITMKQFVSIQGSGVISTAIVGELGGPDKATSAIVRGAFTASLSDLSISNSGGAGGDHSTGIYNEEPAFFIERVDVEVTGGRINTGIYNVAQGTGIILDSSVSVWDGSEAIGIYNIDSEPVITDVNVEVFGADVNIGIVNYNSATTMSRVSVLANAQERSGALGVVNKETSTVVMNDVSVVAEEGEDENIAVTVDLANVIMTNCEASVYGKLGFAVLILNQTPTSQTLIRDATLVAGDGTVALRINADSPATRIVNNLIKGSVQNLLTGPDKNDVCLNNYDGDLQEVNCR